MAEAICDYLNLTYSPDDGLPDGLYSLFNEAMCFVKFGTEAESLWSSPYGGTCKVKVAKHFCLVSASGRFLQHLRHEGMFLDYLGLLSTKPYSITRLDAAFDVYVDAPPVLDALLERYPGKINLTRKAIRVHRFLEMREDGALTGTVQMGENDSGGITARIYDKQFELLTRHGEVVGPRVRYEIVFKKTLSLSLRDAAMPSALFWAHAGDTLLPRPPDVPVWSPVDSDDLGWKAPVREPAAWGGVLKHRVDSSPDLDKLIAYAEQHGGTAGLEYLAKLLERRALGVKQNSGKPEDLWLIPVDRSAYDPH